MIVKAPDPEVDRPDIDLRQKERRRSSGRSTPPVGGGALSADADVPRPLSAYTREDYVEVALAASAGVAVALLLRIVLGWNGVLGSVLWASIGFILASWILQSARLGRVRAVDRMVTTLIWLAGALAVATLAWLVTFVAIRGAKELKPRFFTTDLSTSGPLNPGGGALHAIIGTLEQVGIATAVVVPLAVLTAVYLHELRGRGSVIIRFTVDAMSGLPSIVAGLLVYTLWVNAHGFSGIAAAAALGVLMLPTVTRTSEEILRTIPDTLREASLALGAPRWRVIMRVVLPTARAGLITAVILGIARAIGETATGLLTALGSSRVNMNPLHGPQANLPLFVWSLIRQPNKLQNDRAWTGALVLLMLVLVLFSLARLIGSRGAKKMGRT
jgi:phosphate transport system permease protein